MRGERDGRRRAADPRARQLGASLVELLAALAVVAIATAAGVEGYRRLASAAALHGAADAVRGQLGLARARAVMRRETVRVTLADGDLVVLDASDRVVSRTPLGRGGPLALDSARVRPATIRFNERGQGAPGSVYLYRGRRGVRLVSNFLGRVRRESFALPDG